MSFWNFTRSPASVHLLVEFGREQGLTSTQLLARSGLSTEQLSDPNVEVTAAQELRVTGNLLRQLKRPAGLGLQIGLRYHFSVYGVWGYGLISSRTGLDALDLAVRFLPLTFAFTVITVHREAGLIRMTFGAPDMDRHLKNFLVERDMAAAAILLSEIAGKGFGLERICFETSAPSARDHRMPARVLGAIPKFGAGTNCLVFKETYLQQSLPQASAITAAMCEQMCKQLVERRRARMGVSALVKQYQSAIPADTPSDLGTMAKMLNSSPRTLKRRLREEGTSFTKILAESRASLAQELMRDKSLTLTDIAEQLGFSDLSSFSQAFKRWRGVSPRAYRNHLGSS